jgi:nucleotide-binding universal stress UspA family protein
MVNAKAGEVKEKHPGLKVVPIVMSGSPSRKIIEAAKARETDLIVLGNRGTSGILSWMLGSVSRQVTDACTVPVLVVKDGEFCKS